MGSMPFVPVMLAVAECRPQNNPGGPQKVPVEIEKQELIEIDPEQLSRVTGYLELARELPEIEKNLDPPKTFPQVKYVDAKSAQSFPQVELKDAIPERQKLIEINVGDSNIASRKLVPKAKHLLQPIHLSQTENAGQDEQIMTNKEPKTNLPQSGQALRQINLENQKTSNTTLAEDERVSPQVEENLKIENSLPVQSRHLTPSNSFPKTKQLPQSPQQIAKERSREEQTRQILEGIAEINRRHGLSTKKRRPDYFHFPHSYSRSQSDTFRFPNNPFSNPIFEYLEREKVKPDTNNQFKINFQTTDNQGNTIFEDTTFDDGDSDVDNVPPGQYIKRKVVHKQTVIVPIIPPSRPQFYPPGPQQYGTGLPTLPNAPIGYPNAPIGYPNTPIGFSNVPAGFPNAPIGYPNAPIGSSNIPAGFPNAPIGFPNAPLGFSNIPGGQPIVPLRGQNYVGPSTFDIEEEPEPEKLKDKDNKTLSSLEKETVDNIKNIVLNSQVPQQQLPPVHLNPYRPSMPYYNYEYPYPGMGYLGNPAINLNSFNPAPYANGYNYQLYGPYVVPKIPNENAEPRQQFQWPWEQFFPIIIKDPMMQLMNAVTSMIEYGPQASCRHKERSLITEGTAPQNKLTYEIKNANTAPEITIKGSDSTLQENVTTLDIEDLVIKGDKSDPKKMVFGFKSWKAETRKAKVNGDVSTKINIFNATKDSSSKRASTSKEPKAPEIPDPDQTRLSLFPRRTTTTTTTEQAWIAIKDKPEFDDEREEIEAAEEYYEDQKGVSVSHDGNKKMFSKDNTGSGIFIHKLKVRKGGVAIAGPGGIATAGSGGTAIVGPNGFAYTHPDSLAIAGSGTKVVAVDPTINLSDLIRGNHTRKDGNTPRVGRVVAIGPVVYYNKG